MGNKPYVLIDAMNWDSLEAEVAVLILQGYVPIGGPFVNHMQPCQAMVLKDLAGWIDANRE